MSRKLTSSDRKSLIRLASEMPKGSPERKAILAGLKKSAARLKSRNIYIPREVPEGEILTLSMNLQQGSQPGTYTIVANLTGHPKRAKGWVVAEDVPASRFQDVAEEYFRIQGQNTLGGELPYYQIGPGMPSVKKALDIADSGRYGKLVIIAYKGDPKGSGNWDMRARLGRPVKPENLQR